MVVALFYLLCTSGPDERPVLREGPGFVRRAADNSSCRINRVIDLSRPDASGQRVIECILLDLDPFDPVDLNLIEHVAQLLARTLRSNSDASGKYCQSRTDAL